MDSRWVKGLSGEAKEARKQEVMRHRNSFDELRTLLGKEFLKKEADRDYSAGWEQRQIAINEYNAVLSDILKLLDLTKGE